MLLAYIPQVFGVLERPESVFVFSKWSEYGPLGEENSFVISHLRVKETV